MREWKCAGLATCCAYDFLKEKKLAKYFWGQWCIYGEREYAEFNYKYAVLPP